MKHLQNQPLARYGTFNIGGPARDIYFPESVEELHALLAQLDGGDSRRYVFGNGSNVVFPDGYLDADVIFTTELCDIFVYGDIIAAECGVSLTKAAITACHSALAGAEFMYGIPGTIGGAVVMNAGAYGGEMADAVVGATVYADSKVTEMTASELMFGKRRSALSDTDAVVLSARLLLKEGDPEEIRRKMDANMENRKLKQPLSYPSAGSVFKRPEGYFAGALIEQAGLKGYAVGGAQVSQKHAGFIVNTGVATQNDVRRLVEHIKKTVLSQFGVELECEIKFIGGN